MSAYCFFDVREVVDPQKLHEYRQRATVEQGGGRYLCVAGRCDVVVGEWNAAFDRLRHDGGRA